MTTASTAFYLLVMLYVVGSVLVAYIAIRAYRHVRQRRRAVALPRPVYETTPRKSPFAFFRTNAREFNAWELPVPWTRLSVGSSFQPKAASITSSKDLSIELLPTTALPPPPTSIPTSPPLVDLSTPSDLEASAASRFSTSLPSSPRRQALSLWQQPSSPPHSLIAHRNIQHPAFPRPPSPHALLATTPPQRQKRSRSLGGIPVRRLSGGQSGLRNKVDVESLSQQLVPGHPRGPNEEHLLIDFSPSSDDLISSPNNDPATISPAASDIGVLPPSTVDNQVVSPRPMPLVDITGDDLNVISKSEPDDTAWMWFNSNPPSSIRSYDAQVLAPRPRPASFLGDRKFAFPLPLPFSKTEKLIDIPSNSGDDACLELDSLDSSRTLVEVGDDFLETEDISSPVVPHKDVGVFQTVPIDPFSDDYAVDYTVLQTVKVQDRDSPHPTLVDIDVNECQLPTDQDLPSACPLVDIDGNESRVQNNQDLPAYPPLIDVDDTETSAEAGLVFGTSSVGPSLQGEQTDWRWVETDDPWADNVTAQAETLNPSYGGAVVDSQDHEGENVFMGTSPGGSLLATVLDADDEVPHLSLNDPSLPAEELRLSQVVRGQLDDEDEEDATPRPTPISIDVQLPPSDDGDPLNGIDDTDHMACGDVLETTPPIGHDLEQVILKEKFPDPELLPLPEYTPLFSVVEVIRMSTDKSEDEKIKFERPSSQMPTPPASPPPLSPVVPNQRKAGKSLPPSPMTGPRNLGVASDTLRSHSRTSSPHPAQISLPADASTEDVSVPHTESTENLMSGQAEGDAKGTMELDEVEEHEETSLPGSLPETTSLTTSIISSKTTQTVAALLEEKSGPAPFYPSVRAIFRQPVEIALAMQLRPGLGAGADPAWMVRFLMAMFGWFAVLVSGQENY